eukprot:gene9129-10776_t
MAIRNQTIEELQHTGYNGFTAHQIELFDQSSIEEYLKSTFTLAEFVYASSQALRTRLGHS